jgi:hypothetical protein
MTKSKTAEVHRLEHVQRDRGYRFVDRDPDMLWICNRITATGMSIQEIIDRVNKETKSVVSLGHSTIANWMNGKTKRPQNYTLTWVAYALGVRREWVDIDAPPAKPAKRR